MNEQPHILTIDAGTSSLKAVIYKQNGRMLASVKKAVSYRTPRPGWVEGDPHTWWEALITAVKELNQRAGSLKTIKAMGLTGQMHTPVLLDAQGNALRPAILWLDRRAGAETAELSKTLNLPPYQLNSTYTLPKLLWLSRHRPEQMAKARALLWPKDYLRYRLTGRLMTDLTEAAGAALLDWEKEDWALDRLGTVGLDPALLPPIRPAHADAGPLLPQVARQLGLPEDIKVIVGAGDIIALLAGAPPGDGRLTCSLGSSAMVAILLAEGHSFHDPHHRLYLNYVAPYHLVNGVMSTSGAALDWAFDKLFSNEMTFEDMIERVHQTLPGAEGLLFLPFLAGERSPYWNDDLRGCFYGLSLFHDRFQMVRAVLEGVAFSLRRLIDICRELDVPVQEIALSGGGALVPGWAQIIADICRRPLKIYTAQETVTRPLFAYCTHALDKNVAIESALNSTFNEQPQIIKPQANNWPVYQPIYQSFRKLADFLAYANLPATVFQ